MADVSFIRGTTSGISETPLVDGQLLVDTDKKDILLDVEDSSTHDVERLSMNSIPAGGAAGQVLKKASAADRDVTWGNAASGGGHTIVDSTGTDMADEDDLQFTGGLTVTDDDTNGRTVVSAAGKMNTDGSNAASEVVFDGAFTVGNRTEGSEVGENSVVIGQNCVAAGKNSVAIGDGCIAEGMNSVVSGFHTKTKRYTDAVLNSVDGYVHEELLSPYDSDATALVVLNNEIHLLKYPNVHFKYTSPTLDEKEDVSVLPCTFGQSDEALIYNNEIHFFHKGNDSAHYKYSDGNWEIVESSLPQKYIKALVVLGNEIHGFYNNAHYVYDGNNWTLLDDTTPIKFSDAVVINNEIHCFSNNIFDHRHYKYNGESWELVSSLPGYIPNPGTITSRLYKTVIAFHDYIYMFGVYCRTGLSNSDDKNYRFNGRFWESLDNDDMIISSSYWFACTKDNNIYVLKSYSTARFKNTYILHFSISEINSGSTAYGTYNVGRDNTLFEIGDGKYNNRHNSVEVYKNGIISLDNTLQEKYIFHLNNTAASTAVAFCNKIAFFSAPREAVANTSFLFSVRIKCGDKIDSLFFNSSAPQITSVSLFDGATSKQTISSDNFYYYFAIDDQNDIIITVSINGSFVTSTVAAALNSVVNSKSPGFSCIYAANTLNMTGLISGKGIINQFNGLSSKFNNALPVPHITQHIGDFYFPTGGPRWNVDLEVDPGTAYYAVCYLENTTTGAYFNHSICYAGVPVPTIAAPTVAPAPVAGKVMAFVGTTWTPFVAGVAGVVTDGVVTTKPRLRIQGYHSNNTPTAGLGMHLRLFRIY